VACNVLWEKKVIELVFWCLVMMGMGRPGPGLGPDPVGPRANLRGHGSALIKIVSGLAGSMGILGRPKFDLGI
jgi:hypothetical protein